MSIRIADIDTQVLRDVFEGCRACVYWEYPEHFRRVTPEKGSELKAEWFDRATRELGTCGKLLYVNDEPAAYCQYALPRLLPRAAPGPAGYNQVSEQIDQNAALIS
jgi:hypothetical protein